MGGESPQTLSQAIQTLGFETRSKFKIIKGFRIRAVPFIGKR
jgi:hypothetical protein